MNPAHKRFVKQFQPIADAIARVDIDQEDREAVARSVTNALAGRPDFKDELFLLLASDPLVDCAGPAPGQGCPHDRRIRVAMHYSGAEDGRSKAWQRRMPVVRCVTCGTHRRLGPVTTDERLASELEEAGHDPDFVAEAQAQMQNAMDEMGCS
jgi:hypothetical protein